MTLDQESLRNNGCVLNLPLDNKVGSTTYDYSPPHGKTITAYGDAKQVFSPLSDSKGIANFNGSTDYVTVPASTDWNFGSGDFTWECWINIKSVSTSPMFLSHSNNTDGLFIQANGNYLRYNFYVNSADVINITDTTTPLSLNVWYHVALVRNGSSWKVYLNGNSISSLSTTSSTAYTAFSNVFVIGNQYTTTVKSSYMNGLMKGVRISNIARYTSSFIPQTTKFVNDANTLLLLHFDANGTTFTDSSSYNRTITAYGSAHQVMPVMGKACAYFDGTTDWLQLSDTDDLEITGDYTIELYVYLTALNRRHGLFGKKNIDDNIGPYKVEIYSDNLAMLNCSSDASTYNIVSNKSSTALTAFRWYHVSFVKKGTSYSLYLNGNQEISVTSSLNPISTANHNLAIGAIACDGAWALMGYIDGFRMTKGIARYTSTFTPSTVPFQPDVYTKLLLHFDNTASPTKFIDSSRSVGPHHATVVGDCLIRRGCDGRGIMYFDGSGDYLTVPDNSDLALGSNNFTLMFWINTSQTTSTVCILGKRADTGTYAYIALVMYAGGGLSFLTTVNGTSWAIWTQSPPITTLASNTWTHICIVRIGTYFYAYVNGILSYTSSSISGSIYNNTNALRIGTSDDTFALPFTGYLKDIYLMNGTALSQDQIVNIMNATDPR